MIELINIKELRNDKIKKKGIIGQRHWVGGRGNNEAFGDGFSGTANSRNFFAARLCFTVAPNKTPFICWCLFYRHNKGAMLKSIEQVTQHISVKDLREYIIKHGCYSPEENQRIFEKWFAGAPRYLFRAIHRKYKIADQVICDIGCSYGMNLVFCKKGSYGLETDDYCVKFAHSLGLSVYQRDVLGDDLSDLPKVDVIWCSAVLEHVESPHILLRKMHGLLKDEGLVAVYVPTIPILPSLRRLPRIGRYFGGHLAADHINFFVPQTLRLTCERAGFRTVELSPFYPSILGLMNHIPVLQRVVDGIVYIGRKVAGWDYPEKAWRMVANNKLGFIKRTQ